MARHARERPSLAATDLIAGGSVVVLAVVVASALVLADTDRYDGVRVVGLSLFGLVALALLAAVLGGPWPRARWDVRSLVVLLVVGGVAGALTFPGWAYVAADKDPGGYVMHALQIAQHGSSTFTDPARRPGVPVEDTGLGVRFGSLLSDGGTRIVPQFYWGQSVALAVGYTAHGWAGLRLVTPLEALVGVLLLVAIGRRLGGWPGAFAAGLLLAVDMLQVFQAREPSSEALAQAFWLGGVLWLVVAIQERWAPAGGFAALCVCAGWLDRADGLIAMAMLVTLGSATLALRRWDGRAWWALGATVLLVPLGAWQAFDLAGRYSRDNGIPAGATVAVAGVVLVAFGALLRRLPPGVATWVAALPQRPWLRITAGVAISAGIVTLAVLAVLRRHLFGDTVRLKAGVPTRTYDEISLQRLSWYLSWPVIAVAVLGAVLVALRPWRLATWVVALPTLFLSAVYLNDAHVSAQLMFWGRRFVPNVVPGIVLLAALAGAAVWQWTRPPRWLRVVLRVGLAGALAAAVTYAVPQSLTLRTHEEWSGTQDVAAEIAHLSGGEDDTGGIYLWDLVGGCCDEPWRLLAGPVWVEQRQLSVALPHAADGDRTSYVDAYLRHFPGRKVFVVDQGFTKPKELAGVQLSAALTIDTQVRVWESRIRPRPSAAVVLPLQLTVWRVEAASRASSISSAP
ncbi:MAG TPA: hypothetical protein VHE83_01260 [Mycobacteriales bacterium]|nr:hypothetical protein [Mycobacteriales bacterium]